MSVLIVGVGALGSHLLQFCRNMDFQFVIIDFDRVEAKNTKSQFHSVMGLGKNKTKALADLMRGLYKRDVATVPYKLEPQNIETVMHGVSLAVDCTDNEDARKLLQDWCRIWDIPLLHGALAANGQYGRVMWMEFFKIDENSGGAATCENGEFLPFIAFVSSIMALELQNFLATGKKRSFHVTPGGIIQVA
jgi:molybdopterin/thiamine biosynthesis adenylyltransferase